MEPVVTRRFEERERRRLGQDVPLHVCRLAFEIYQDYTTLTGIQERLHSMDNGHISKNKTMDSAARYSRAHRSLVWISPYHFNSKSKPLLVQRILVEKTVANILLPLLKRLLALRFLTSVYTPSI